MKRRWFQVDMEVPQRISEDRFNEIIRNIREDCSPITERDEIINGHIRLAIVLVGAFTRFNNSFANDLFGEAQLALTEGTNQIWTKKYPVNNAEHGSRYLNYTMSHRMKDHLDQSRRTVIMPGRTVRFRMVNGLNLKNEISDQVRKENIPYQHRELLIKYLPPMYQDTMIDKAKSLPLKDFKIEILNMLYSILPLPKVEEVGEDYPELDEEEIIHRDVPYHVPIAKPVVSAELMEALQKSILSPIEDAIIKMRAEGMTYQEIAPRVGLSYVMVGNYVNRVAERFDKIYK